MIANFLLLLFLSVGLGGFIPALNTDSRLDWGLRLLSGYALLVCLLYTGIVLLQWGFSLTLYLLISVAICGGFLWVRRMMPLFSVRELLWHPILVLSAMIIAVALVHGPIHFAPYGDDTFINWLTHAKQIWLIDGFWDDRIASAAKGYMPGWHLLLGFTSPLWHEFSDTRAIAAPAVLHVALIAASYDVISAWAKTCKLNKLHVRLFAYSVIFLLLAVEASWQLVPTLILSEMPLFYTLIGLFIMGSLFYSDGARPLPIAFVLGLILCMHYLIKTQGLAALPIAFALAFVGSLSASSLDRKSVLKAFGVSLIVLIPTVLVMVSWKTLGPQSPKCIANAGDFLGKGLGQLAASSQWKVLIRDMADFIGPYLLSYKIWLTLVALAGAGAALFDRKLQWLSLALIAYIAVYLIAVYWAYLSCPDGFNSYLSSLPRYLQLPVRLLHFIGPMMLAMVWLKFCVSFLGNSVPRPVTGLLCVAIGLLAAYQMAMIKKSYATLQSPNMGKMEFYANVIPVETEAMLKAARAHGIDNPKVLLVHNFYEFLPYLMAVHYGLKKSPDDIEENLALARSRLTPLQLDKIKPGTARVPEFFEGYDVLWALDSSDLISNEMSKITDNQACADHPARYFLIRSGPALKSFTCVLKADYN